MKYWSTDYTADTKTDSSGTVAGRALGCCLPSSDSETLPRFRYGWIYFPNKYGLLMTWSLWTIGISRPGMLYTTVSPIFRLPKRLSMRSTSPLRYAGSMDPLVVSVSFHPYVRMTTIGVELFSTQHTTFHAASADAKKVSMVTNCTISNRLLLKSDEMTSSWVAFRECDSSIFHESNSGLTGRRRGIQRICLYCFLPLICNGNQWQWDECILCPSLCGWLLLDAVVICS